MTIKLEEGEVAAKLAPLLNDPSFRTGIDNLTGDDFFIVFFLASVSQGEGLGEAAVGMIGQEELAQRIRELKRHELEERGHKERTIEVALELFPEYFDDGAYRYPDSLQGREYYIEVLNQNRARLKQCGHYSRLNQYLTTTFGYEIMVVLLYRAVADALRDSELPQATRDRVVGVLDGILAEEETHVNIIQQHNALLATPREDLSQDARDMLDALSKLDAEDYLYPAELSVRQIVTMMSRYADPETYRAAIESGKTEGK